MSSHHLHNPMMMPMMHHNNNLQPGIGGIGGTGAIGGNMQIAASLQQQQQQMQLQQQQQEKINRELFVGNTPAGTSELLILHFLNAAMRRCGLCGMTETPIIDSRVNNKFAFVELTSAEMANRALSLNGIPFLGIFLKVSRPSKYTGPSVPSQTWQQLTGQIIPGGGIGNSTTGTNDPNNANAAMMMMLDPEQEKLSRELFIGNTTPEMTDAMIRDFLGTALQQVGLATAPGNPIVSCRVSGKFAFVELRSAQEATNALNLNHIPYMGTSLRVGRPSKWTGPMDQHGNWEDILAKYMAGEMTLPSTTTATTTTAAAASSTTTIPTSAASTLSPPSRIVELRNMVTADDLVNDQEYQEILEDIQAECSQFGQLKQVIIPRPSSSTNSSASQTPQPPQPRVYLEYSQVSEATAAIQQLQGRTFDGRHVLADFFNEEAFLRGEYTSE